MSDDHELDSMSEDEEGDELVWNLGFVEKPERRTDLLRHRFPSKVGGIPAWLDPVHLPLPSQLEWRDARTSRAVGLRFLLQIYAAVDDAGPNAFHRTIYLFVHPEGRALGSPGGVRALRCQLPRANAFYPSSPAGPNDTLPPPLGDELARHADAGDPWGCAGRELRLRGASAAVDAARGGFAAAKGEVTDGAGGDGGKGPGDERRGGGEGPSADEVGAGDLAGRPPRVLGSDEAGAEQRSGGAGRRSDGSPATTPGGTGAAERPATSPPPRRAAPPAAPVTFPELELVVEPEPEEDEAAALAVAEKASARRLEELGAARAAGADSEDEDAVVAEVEGGVTPAQHAFAAFQARVAAAPAQCLRYCADPGARPLCPSDQGVPGPDDIPPCTRCGAPRRFEFQVMPQLLNHLGQDAADVDALDWGALAVYTCSASCSPAPSEVSAYADEYVWIQPPAA